MVLNPRESGKFVSSQTNNIKIVESGIQKLGDEVIKQINSGKLSVNNFSQVDHHPKSDNPDALDWLLVVDTLNFCFWSPESEVGWKVDGYTGYFALCAAINRAIKEGVDILNPKFYGSISKKDLLHILRSDSEVNIPLFDKRIDCLHEVGKVLSEKFNGTFKTMVLEAENSAIKLLNLIVNNFPCFKDEAIYKGQDVAIYKRAQILVADTWACFRGSGLGLFKDINELTMFADYRVPQSLLYFGVFEYGEELMKKLNSHTLFKNGEEMEVEIRCCSIHAVELLRDYVKSKITDDKMVNSIILDHFLWDFRRQHAKEMILKKLPFHKTLCIYY